jgi:hypothetical protein
MAWKIFGQGWRAFKLAEHAHFGDALLSSVLDWRGWLWTAGSIVLSVFVTSISDWTAAQVWVASLICGACVAIIYIAVSIFLRSPSIPARRDTPSSAAERPPPAIGLTATATGTVGPPLHYSQREIDEQILPALGRIATLLNHKAIAAQNDVGRCLQNWIPTLQGHGHSESQKHFENARKSVQEVVNEASAIVRDSSLFKKEIGQILNNADFAPKYFAALDRLAVDVNKIGTGSIDLIKPQRDAFDAQVKAFDQWVSDSKNRLDQAVTRFRSLASDTPKSGPSIDRIPCTELMKIATELGWTFTDQHSLHLIDLQDAIRQGALDGHLTVWGKLNKWPRAESLMRKEVIEKIPPAHWREFRVHLFAALEGDNFHTYSWHPAPSQSLDTRYVDLHVDRSESVAWLNKDALAFKGKTTVETRI